MTPIREDILFSGVPSKLFRGKKPLRILLYFVVFILLSYWSVYFMAGRKALLQLGVKIRPYAFFYVWADSGKPTHASKDKLVLFFGDSTVAAGPNSKNIPEMLESSLVDEYPELKGVSVRNWAFGSATLFHSYCLMFKAEKYSPDLIIMPINKMWLGGETAKWTRVHLRKMVSMVPWDEFLSRDAGNPLRLAGISLSERIWSALDMHMLCAGGAKLWLRTKLDLRELKPTMEQEWWPFGRSAIGPDLYPGHPSLRLLRYLAKAAEKRDIHVLFYIHPVPYDKRDRDKYDREAKLLLEAAATRTTECIDFGELLDSSQYGDGVHCTESGKIKIATSLTPEVHKFLTPNASLFREAR